MTVYVVIEFACDDKFERFGKVVGVFTDELIAHAVASAEHAKAAALGFDTKYRVDAAEVQ